MRIDDGNFSNESSREPDPLSASSKQPDAERDPSTAPTSSDYAFSEPHAAPVFYDERHRRWPWFLRGAVIALFVFIAGAVLLLVSIFALPLMPRSPLPREAPILDNGNANPILSDFKSKVSPILNYKIRKDILKNEQLLKEQESALKRLEAERDRKAEEFLRQSNLPSFGPTPPVVIAGFYVNWDQTSRASLHRHIGALTHVIPEWLHLKQAGANYRDPSETDRPFVDGRTSQDRNDITPFVRSHKVPILPSLNNYTSKRGSEAGAGDWDPLAVHQIVSDPIARANVVRRLLRWLTAEKMQGITIDFEEIQPADRDNLVVFFRMLYSTLHSHGFLVTQQFEVENSALDLTSLARYNDWLIPMCYDQHAAGSVAGPVAGADWTAEILSNLLKQVPARKLVMGVGNHAYDWMDGDTRAETMTYQSAVVRAKENPEAVIHLESKSLNPTYTYVESTTDKAGNPQEEKHTVWMQDAVSVYNQLKTAKRHGLLGGALWYCGSEDPSLWTFYSRHTWDQNWGRLIANGVLNKITYGGQAQVDFEGEGCLLQPLAPPSDGLRDTRLDPHTGLITSETYLKDAAGNVLLPSSYVVRRYGGSETNVDKQICLTFDDGPDPEWTPQILDILQKYNVPACFFVVGKQAEEYQNIVTREWEQGFEIGDHSFTHPDLFRLSTDAQRLQLTATQRVIQAITGHSTTLFRPPYGGDTEPATGKEVSPLENAANLNYITVGETNDPQDWRIADLKPGTEAQDPSRPRDYRDIVRSVIVNRNVGNVVLLHDAGGDRSRTVAALPQIITGLRSMGYHFVSVGYLRHPELAQKRGMTFVKLRDTVMPPVAGKDLLLVGADRYVFEVMYIFQRTLSTLFVLSIVLGVSRVVLFLGLALVQRYREKRRVYPVGYAPLVSVIIAAYNEEKVIARTVRTLLESDYAHIEVLVVDDGSRDQTSAVVEAEFRGDPRVRLFRKENGGKASALNRGIASANGEVIISLDADTLFARTTVEHLVRHFKDPAVGAVSGNVRVGNAHNLLTRWQSLEYTTSQNFDRRGYDLLNCITVVPGAVGALRRTAVRQVGGYTSDTLAEDTDLTWKLRRAGWRIVNDNSAMAYTEAPETLRNLAKQRFRWAFGTLQCLWKHRGALGQNGAFGWLALPSLWLYQILFPAVSPFMDIAMVFSIFTGNFVQFATYFLFMFAIEFVAAFIALRMDRGDMMLLPWLFLQRFVYRQLMYYVILKSLLAAVRGGAVGWGKLERTGKAQIEGTTESHSQA